MTAVEQPAPNLVFSHMGLSVTNIEVMESFYSRALGFAVTDRGVAGGMHLVFLSRSPVDHHQIVLASGRPKVMPPNTDNDQFGPSINQISFKMGTLADLRDMRKRLEAEGASAFFPANHGVAWSIYAHDPEGNNLEFFVDTDWYITQPLLRPLDLSKTDAEIFEETREFCKSSAGFEPLDDWRKKVALRMIPFIEPTAALPSTAP